MIIQESFLKKLRSAFDLNIYEVKIWTALLSKGIATAGELSDISNVPRSRSYDVLESLEKRGFVVMKLGKPIKYIAVKPEEVVKRVKGAYQEKAETQVKDLESVEETAFFKELSLLHKNGINHIDPSSISGSIRGRANLYNHISSMLENAEKNVTIVTSSKGLHRKLQALEPLFKRLEKKKVSIRIATKEDKKDIETYKKIIENCDLRDAKDIDARFVLVDSRELLFMINNDDEVHESYDIGIWVNSPFFVSAFEKLFDTKWNKLNKLKV